MSAEWSWTVEEVLEELDEELEETLPDASKDDSKVNDCVEDGSLPDASTTFDSDISLPSSQESLLPDASLDISGSILVDPTVGSESHKEFLFKCTVNKLIITGRDEILFSSTSSTPAMKKGRHSAKFLPVHCSTPVKTSNNSGSIVDSSDVSSKYRPISQNDSTKSHASSCFGEDDVQDVLKLQAWKLTSILQFKGCGDNCAKQTHGLNECEILSAHSQIASLTNYEKNVWLLNYFSLQCPRKSNGEKDIKKISYVMERKCALIFGLKSFP